ncbi:MAG: penicillin-binding protein 2 [Candidatus Omnitrophica bacterium]|nr:penicillin-binding protein 2 [Candidatus Omnitrophota bacterium]
MHRSRQYLVLTATVIVFFFLIIKLFTFQIIGFSKFKALAEKQHDKSLEMPAVRGTIYDKFMEPLAININKPSIYANPHQIANKQEVALKLSKILGMDENEIVNLLSKSKYFVWIKRIVDMSAADRIKALKIDGLGIIMENRRIYPNCSLAAHVLGFAGVDNRGLEGIELYYDDKLKGEAGYQKFIKDARSNPVFMDYNDIVFPQNGLNIVLTIDTVIQFIVEEELKKMVDESGAKSGYGIIMDPNTGRILAMANYPTFDLNNFGAAEGDIKKNSCVTDMFEPGSVFKIVTASAALNEGLCDLDDTFFCENGNWPTSGRILHDVHPYGKLTFKEVIAKSSNIGSVKIGMKVGENKMYTYMKKFGFGENTGVDLPGETPGIVRHPRDWSRSDITTIPIGQGVAVTPIQLLAAVSVIANNGYLMRPFIIDKIMSADGFEIVSNSPGIKWQVVNAKTCRKMKDILEAVVLIGTGKKAFSEKYTMCGKTGTAQVANPGKGYYADRYNASFVGFAPKDKPQIAFAVIAKEPRGVHFGGSIAGPAVKNIVERVLDYMGTGDAEKMKFKYYQKNCALPAVVKNAKPAAPASKAQNSLKPAKAEKKEKNAKTKKDTKNTKPVKSVKKSQLSRVSPSG